jgi:uncharacterized protein YbjT (DUF2867 family)
MTTLVIGARGSVGRHVVDQLLAAGEPVRASVRNPASADLPAGVSVVAADLTRPDTLTAAMDGVRDVFLYAPLDGVGADAFVKAARDADLARIVLFSSGSVLLPYATGNAIAEEHRSVERTLTEAGLDHTPIRPLVLANNASRWAKSIRADGVVRLLYPDAVTAPIHERDIAAVAVAALTGRGGTEVSAMLTGPELLSQRQQVALVGEAIGREIRIDELSESQARAEFGQFENLETVNAIIELIAASTHGGSPATDTVARVLGRPATPFTEWVRDHVEEFR